MWLHNDYTYIHTHLIIIYNHMIYTLIMRNCETGVQSRPLRALAARRWSRALVSLPIEAATWPPACTNENTRALCDHLNHLNHLYMSVLHLSSLSRLRNYLWCVWSVIFPGVRAGILQNGKTIYKMTFWDLKNCTIKLGANQVHLKWMSKWKWSKPHHYKVSLMLRSSWTIGIKMLKT